MRNKIVGRINFGRAGNAVTGNDTGWSGPEDGFTWTIGAESTLQLPEADYTRPTILEIRGGPYISDDVRRQRILFSVDGRKFGQHEWRFGAAQAFQMPATRDRRPALTVHHPDARPSQGRDTRTLAFAFRAIQVIQTNEPLVFFSRQVVPLKFAAAADPPAISQAMEEATGLSVADIVTSFESVGDDCELGFVQRRFGAEPLGLLRFSSSVLDAVIDGMDSAFEGVIEGMDPRPDPGCSNEWIVHIKRYGMHYHTFLYEHEMPLEDIVKRETTKTKFLVAKLISDLSEGTKIFVLKNFQRALLEAEAPAMFLAIQRRGPGTLLWVTPAPPEIAPGTIELIAPGFWHGHIDHFARNHNMQQVSVHGWATLMTNAKLVSADAAGLAEATSKPAR